MKAEQVRALALALALPGMVEKPHFELSSFRLEPGGIVATLTADGAELRVFLKNEEARDAWLRREPQAITAQLWGGKRVGLAVRLALARSTWVRELLEQAWQERAPRAGRAS